MIPTPRYIRNFQSVIDAFGYWPMFHDSPVLAFNVTDEVIKLEVEAWETTNKTDPQGYFILAKRHLVGFEFRDIVSTDLEHFIPKNILFELLFSTENDQLSTGQFTIGLDSAMGSDVCGEFTAKVGSVSYVRPSNQTIKEGEQVGDGDAEEAV